MVQKEFSIGNALNPKNHIIISGAAVLAFAFFYNIGFFGILLWVAIAIFATVLIDSDHLVVAFFIADKRKIVGKALRNWSSTLLDIEAFRKKIHFKGFTLLRLLTHLLGGLLILALFYFLLQSLFVPALISLAFHFIADVIHSAVHPELW
ncbi:hypothetical protein HY991_03410 [Candidatus Micrarchaeota archaeon]|nr:hypothetical protein [Candidatus Micrarchaeota archaeon]